MKYIADSIEKQDMIEWSEQNSKIMISAQTGAGKTYFLIFKLCAFLCIEQRKKILITLPRWALLNQYEQDLKRLCLQNMQDMDELHSRITIMTYQNLELKLLQNQDDVLTGYDVWIADEVHYFLQDSEFNCNTSISLHALAKKFAYKMCVFLSGTMENVRPLLQRILERYPSKILFKSWTEPPQKHDWREVVVKKAYDYLNVVLAKSEEEVYSTMVKSSKKSMIFVNSKNDAENIMKCMEELNPQKKVMFLDSEAAHSHLSDFVCGDKLVPEILISTTVLDSGVSIRDGSVQFLFIKQTLYEPYIQCLGRKRVQDGEKVTLFLYNPGAHVFFNKARAEYDVCSEWCRYLKSDMPLNEYITAYYQEIDHSKFKKLVYWKNELCQINELSIAHFQYAAEYHWRIYQMLSDGNSHAFIDDQLKWLEKGADTMQDIGKERETAMEQLLSLLEGCTDEKMRGTKERDCFINKKVKPLIEVLDPTKIDTKGKLTTNKLNEFLEAQRMPYQISKEGERPTYYSVTKIVL